METTSNPFESNESIFLSTDSRATQRRKGKKRKSRFLYKQEREDPEIQAAIDNGKYSQYFVKFQSSVRSIGINYSFGARATDISKWTSVNFLGTT